MNNLNYSIFINTCDKFEDCWDPFFKLFAAYWPNYKGKIYLNTEYKDYSYENLNIIPLKIAKEKQDGHLITWSECLKRAMTAIEEDIVLYMQEDYFLKDTVKNDMVNDYVKLMGDHNDIHCIHLTDQVTKGIDKSFTYDGLSSIPQIDQNRVSCQAALWQRKVLLQYIRTYESAWNFEWWGSKRAGVLKHNFYVVNHDLVMLNKFEIIPYIFTGVIGGKWYEKVVPLFEKHDIHVDYNKRGFSKEKAVNFKDRLKAKIKRFPVEIRSSFGILRLKFLN